jgi:diacylglycerol O-acyltransferase
MTTRLSALDSAFLAVETPTAHMHVGWAAVHDPPAEGPRPSFEELRDHIGSRVGRAPRYRQLLRSVPLGLNAPVWADDPSFDISRHVVRADRGRLGDVVEACMSEPLPRDRPLWQMRIAPRLEDDRIALVGKAHHCMVDGLAAVELTSMLLDPEPESPPDEPDSWRPGPTPRPVSLLAGGIADLTRRTRSPRGDGICTAGEAGGRPEPSELASAPSGVPVAAHRGPAADQGFVRHQAERCRPSRLGGGGQALPGASR